MTKTILGIAGSLRKESYNKALLQESALLLAPQANLVIADISDVPLYNQDLENPLPPSIQRLKKQIQEADGILLSTPEYNYSMPGVLKNLFDWCSRPYGKSAWDGKRIAMMGATPGMQGTARAQYHLRQVFVGLNLKTLNRPELMISLASSQFDASGKLTDPKTRQKLKEFLEAFLNLLRQSE